MVTFSIHVSKSSIVLKMRTLSAFYALLVLVANLVSAVIEPTIQLAPAVGMERILNERHVLLQKTAIAVEKAGTAEEKQIAIDETRARLARYLMTQEDSSNLYEQAMVLNFNWAENLSLEPHLRREEQPTEAKVISGPEYQSLRNEIISNANDQLHILESRFDNASGNPKDQKNIVKEAHQVSDRAISLSDKAIVKTRAGPAKERVSPDLEVRLLKYVNDKLYWPVEKFGAQNILEFD